MAVNASLVRKQIKAKKLSPLMVQALCGLSSLTPTQFNLWMREGAVPLRVAEVLTEKLGISL